MRKGMLPYYLQNLVIRGFEDENPPKKKEDGEGNDDEEEDDENDEGGESKDKDTGNDALKSALQKERRARKAAERQAKELQKFKEEKENADKSETDKAKDEATKAADRATKLANKLRDTAVDNAIIKQGGKLKFRDIDDALKLIDRSAIEVDQDEDEPDDITVDESSVEAALKALAKAKPHLIIAEGQEDKSGSKFGGGRKPQKDADEDALRDRYPALNRSGHNA